MYLILHMNKFSKRILKVTDDKKSSLVIGHGFGFLSDIVETFDTVFIISPNTDKRKYRNVVYRENFNNLISIGAVSAVFVDLDKVDNFKMLLNYWTMFSPIIFVEGNEPIDRTKSSYLYKYGYRCIDKLGFCHLWKKI